MHRPGHKQLISYSIFSLKLPMICDFSLQFSEFSKLNLLYVCLNGHSAFPHIGKDCGHLIDLMNHNHNNHHHHNHNYNHNIWLNI